MGSMSLVSQQLDELDTLIAEAHEQRRFLVIEACERVSRAVLRGMRPLPDDANIVQCFIADRQRQNRYGQ